LSEKALAYLNEFLTVNLLIFPGAGKTVIVSWLLSRVGGLSCILLENRSPLIDQWKTTITNFTDARVLVVGTFNENTTVSFDNVDVVIMMKTALANMSLIRPDLTEKIENLVIDEAHTLCTPSSVRGLLATSPKRIIVCTATLERENNAHQMIRLMTGNNDVYKISQKPFNVIKYYSGIKVPMNDLKDKSGNASWTKITRFLTESEARNEQIYDIVDRNPNWKILILTQLVEHAKGLYREILRKGHSCDYMAGSKKSYQDSHVLVGSIKKIGTGFDEATACESFNGVRINLLILTQSIKKSSLLEQVAGRVFRADYPCIIHFIDECPIIKRHWTGNKKWYESRNGNIMEHQSQYYVDNMSKIPDTNNNNLIASHMQQLRANGKI